VSPAPSGGPRPAGVIRWVDRQGRVSLVGVSYKAGRVFAGEPVEVVVRGGLVEIVYKNTVIATHAERRAATASPRAGSSAPRQRRAPLRAAATGPRVTRVADAGGSVSFAGTMYRAGRSWARQKITVAVVAGSVQLSVDDKVIRVHPIRHDRAKEHGAFSTPTAGPAKPKPPRGLEVSPRYRSQRCRSSGLDQELHEFDGRIFSLSCFDESDVAGSDPNLVRHPPGSVRPPCEDPSRSTRTL
jgi:hypothetical protein